MAASGNPRLAYRVNALGTQNIALACGQCGAAMVHVSTNDVFDGKLGRPYYEWDSPSPQSVYARSKAAAEFYVRTLLNPLLYCAHSLALCQRGQELCDQDHGAADRHGRLRSSPTR